MTEQTQPLTAGQARTALRDVLEAVIDARTARVVALVDAELAGLEAVLEGLDGRSDRLDGRGDAAFPAPLACMRELLMRAFEIDAGAGASMVAQRLEEGVARFPGVREPRQLARRLGRVLGFESAEEAPGARTLAVSGTGGDEALAGMLELIAAATRLRPALLVFRNPAAADAGSAELISGLARAQLPVLLVFAAAPGGALPTWVERLEPERLHLSPAPRGAPAATLSPRASEVLAHARLSGERTWRSLLRMLDGDEALFGDSTAQPIAELERAGLLVRAPWSPFEGTDGWEVETGGGHAASLSDAARTRGHLTTARWLAEQCHPERLGEFGAAIAGQLEAAGAPERAVEFLTRAGALALRLKAFAEAVAWFERGLPHCTEAERAVLLCRLGSAHQGMGEFATARSLLEESARRAEQAGAREVRLEAMRLHARVLFDVGEYGPARTEMKAALSLARALEDAPTEMYLLRQLGYLALAVGERHAARAWYSEALTLSERHGSELEAALALNGLGETERMLRRYGLAEDLYRRALERMRKLGDPSWLPLPLGNLGVISLLQGRLAEAEASQQEALALARRLGNKWMTAHALEELGLVAAERHDAAAAARALLEALALDEQIGATPRLLYALLGVARLALDADERAVAIGLAGVAQAHPARDWEIEVLLEPLRARVGMIPPREDAVRGLPGALREARALLERLRSAA